VDDNLSRILADNKSDEATRVMIDKMLLERLALAAIARITGVSERWLQIYVNNKYEQIQQKVDVTQKKTGKLTIQRIRNVVLCWL
jgi:DNA-binding transcriptional regulator/RsmH inhibitor MraZ